MKITLTFLLFFSSLVASYAQNHAISGTINESVLVEKIKLDSTIEIYFRSDASVIEKYKQEFYYDEQGNQRTKILFVFDKENRVWEKKFKWECDYDSNNKLVLEFKYEWDKDNISWLNTSKHEFGYDIELNMISDVFYFWNLNDKEWFGTSKFEYEYDANGNKLLDSEYDWNWSDRDWKGISKLTFLYDSLNNRTLETTFMWEGIGFENGVWEYGWRKNRQHESIFNPLNLLATSIDRIWYGEWTNQNKNEYDYNDLGNIKSNTSFFWNSSLMDWKPLEKYELVIDTIKLEGLATQNQWSSNDSVWQVKEKCEIKLDENGNYIEQLTWKIDYTLDSLIRNEKIISQYDERGHKTGFIQSRWNLIINDWELVFKEETLFDAENRITSLARWNWEENLVQWTGKEKHETIFDDFGNAIENIKYSWDAETGDWIGDFSTVFDFDTSVPFSELVVPNYWKLEKNIIFKLDTEIKYLFENISKSWKVGSRIEHYYSSKNINSTRETVLEEILIYPNPTSEFIQISNLKKPVQFELFSASGIKVKSFEVSEHKTIPVNNLMPGIYIYRLKNDKHFRSGKIIIQ